MAANQCTTIINELNNLYCSNYGNNVHGTCGKMYDKILNNLSIFNNYNQLFTSFINSNIKQYYLCHTTNKSIECFKILINLIDIDTLDFNTFKTCVNLNKQYLDCIVNLIIKKKNISSEVISKILYTKNKLLISTLFDDNNKLNLNLNESHYNYLCKNNQLIIINTTINNNYYGRSNLATEENFKISTEFNSKIILHLINSKVKVTKKAINYALIHKISPNIIKQLITMGPGLCTDYLIAACHGQNKEMIEFLLDNKIVPTSDCIKALFTSAVNNDIIDINEKYGKNMFYEKSVPVSPKDSINIKNITELLNILLNYNYTITYDDLIFITKYYVTIPNIQKYNLTFDNKFLEICSEIGFYPPYDHNIKPDIRCLQKECIKSGNLQAIKELVLKQKIKPDNICIQNACIHKANLPTIRFLVDNNASVDYIALKNIISITGNSSTNFVMEEFIKQYLKDMEELKKLKKQQHTNPPIIAKSITNELVINKDNEPQKVVISNIEENKDNKIMKLEHINNQNISDNIIKDDDYISESDDEIPKKKIKKISIKVKTNKKDIKSDDNKDNIINNDIKTIFEDYTLIKTNIEEKEQISISDKFIKYFNLEKDSKLTILSFKRLLLNYLNNNKLIKKDNFVITLNEDMCNSINFDYKKYDNKLDIKNLDKFCAFVLDNIKNNEQKQNISK